MPTDTTDRALSDTPDTPALLQRILSAVENKNRRGRLELAIAIILSLAALASTWCGYQARQWGSVQSNAQVAADTAERKAAENTIVGLQLRTFDGITMLEYWAAMRRQDTEAQAAIHARFRPQLRTAIDASLAAGVLTDPQVEGPLQRPEYILTEEQDAKRLREEAVQLNAQAQSSGKACGSYISLTLMFAMVLFFGGITGTFSARRVRSGLGGAALVLFLVTLVSLIGLPICRG